MKLEELLVEFQKKDIKAFEALYEMYSANICGSINIIVKNNERAREICQDVFVKVWKNASSYNSSKGRFFTWVLNIARNAAIDEVRSKSHKQAKLNLPVESFVGIIEDKVEEPNDLDLSQLRNLVKNLKQMCIELIELIYFRGYSQKEVSKALDIPVGTVKSRNRNCMSQLRENIKVNNGH